MKKLFSKVFDKHHKIERFGISFLVLVLMFVAIVVSLASTSYRINHQTLSSKAMYTDSFTMSRTQAKADVKGIYTNKDHTKSLVLVKFEDVSKLSIDANNYTAFLRGYDQNKGGICNLTSNPKGALYILGTSGYMAFYFVDKEGMEPQIWHLTLRNDKELRNVTSSDVEVDTESGQTSQYAEYDLGDIYFNPVASEATYIECLDNDVVTVRDIYEACIARSTEQTIRATLAADLKSMRADLATISEYAQRLEAYGIAINKTYPCIDGDYIVNQDGTVVATMDTSSAVGTYKEDDVLYLKSNTVLAGGVDFDWYNGNIFDGYLTKLAGSKSIDSYVDSITKSKDEDDKTVDTTWYYKTNGKEFTLNSSSGFSQTTTDINSAISGLQSAWDTYYQRKKQYETVDLMSLLELDYQVMNIESNYSVNGDSDTWLSVTR